MPAKILVTDDEADLELLVRQQFHKQIRQKEYEFLFARNGAEALERLEAEREIRVVLTDLNMQVAVLEEGQRANQRLAAIQQFFSPGLAERLGRDPDLLEGRNQEVTVLISDLRGFSPLAERLGPEQICRLIRDMMERLSSRIVE